MSDTKKTLGERNYEQFAEQYTRMSATKAHNAYYDRPAVLGRLPKDLRNTRVLDAGCGPGHYTEVLLERGAEVVAFDVTPDFVQIASARVGGHDHATVLRHDLTQPFGFAADNSFDYVVCALVLDYIEDWEAVYREFRRVLKPGGQTVASHGHPMGDYLYINRKFPNNKYNYFNTHTFTVGWGGFGEQLYDVTSYRRPLQAMINPILAAGLKLVEVYEPLPVEAMKAVDPEAYDELQQHPAFLCLRAEK